MWKGKKSGPLTRRGRKREFPIRAAHYELLEPIGDGATAVVRRARCRPLGGEVVAVKIMNMAQRTESDVVRTSGLPLIPLTRRCHVSLIIHSTHHA